MNSVKSLISNGNTKSALDMLLELTEKENKLKKEALTLKAKFIEISRQHQIGIANNQEYNQEINKINYGVLGIEEQLKIKHKKRRTFRYIYLIASVVGIGLLGLFYFTKPDKYDFHVYQLSYNQDGIERYNEKALKHLVSELNGITEYFQIILHDRQLEPIENISYSTENYSVIVKEIHEIHKPTSFAKEGVAVLIDFPLNTKDWSNLFSATGLNYSVFSIWGLSSEYFSPKDYDSFILRYILLEIIRISTINRLMNKGERNLVHPAEQFKGCLLDFMEDKTEIINSIDKSKFCSEHEMMIKEKLGKKVFAEYNKIVKLGWIDAELKEVLEKRYQIKI